MTRAKTLGNYGESLAAEYLKRHGYEVIHNNYRSGRSELDLVARKGRQTIFFEVKTISQNQNFCSEIPLTSNQARNLKRGLSAYCIKNHVGLDAVHLDLLIVSVDRENKSVRFKHYRDIF